MRDILFRRNGTRDAVLAAIESGQDSAAAVVDAAMAHKRMCETIETCAYLLAAAVLLWIATRDA